jgi:hypothetical protein
MATKMVKHLHHIVPKHMGGTDDPSNLVEITIEEHAEAHHKLYEQHGLWQDKLAWEGLAGIKSGGEVQAEAVRRTNLGRKHTDEERAKMSANRRGIPSKMKGKKLSDNQKKNMKGFTKGHSEETKAKMRATHLARGTRPPNRWKAA